MMNPAIDSTTTERPPRAERTLPLFAYGFRPFFLLAGLYAALALPLWLVVYRGVAAVPSYLPPALWHGHEMLFGYAAAVLAGFLLTATPSWSGTPPLRGTALGALAALWLAGRVAVLAGALAPVAAAAIDLAFLPALVLAVLPALRKAARRNLVILAPLTALVAFNLLVHLDALGAVASGLGSQGLLLALDTIALLIALIGGRIVPAFTANALKAKGDARPPRPFGTIDRLALASLVALILADLAAPGGAVAGAVALAAAVLHALRLQGWATARTLDRPILWVLHLGYAWLVVGLAWKGLVDLTGLAAPTEALHGLAVGAVGTMTLAVMSRAIRGHTGRPLAAGPATTASYVLVSAAGLARLAAALVPSGLYLPFLDLSGLLWSAAFLLFVTVHAPMLLRPRIDGKPG